MTTLRPLLHKRGFLWLTLIVLSLISGTAISLHFDFDHEWTSQFYSKEQGWWLAEEAPWSWLYRYGTIPGLLLTIGGTVFIFLTYIKPHLQSWRHYVLILVLTSILGPGVIVNAILKDYWGRTRPRQTQDFGGRWEYREVISPGVPGKGKSFPCGHCAMAYVFTSCIFLYRKSRVLALVGAGFGLGYGLLMSLTRMLQGAHFPTDAFWSLGVVLLVSTTLYYFVVRPPERELTLKKKSLTKRQAVGFGFSFLVGIVVMVFFFATRRPVFEDFRHNVSLLQDTQSVHLRTNLPWENITVRYRDQPVGHIQTIVRGFGWPQVSHALQIERMPQDDGVFYVNYQLTPQGYFAERNIEMIVSLPKRLEGKLVQLKNDL